MGSSRLTEDQRRTLFYAAADRGDYFGRLRDRVNAAGRLTTRGTRRCAGRRRRRTRGSG